MQLIITRENSSVFNLRLQILINSEDVTNSDKSLQTEGEAAPESDSEALSLYSD